ncbi:MAG: radical SAM protein [Coriobacteriia bacterium]
MDSLGALQHRTTDRAVARSLAAIGKLVADAPETHLPRIAGIARMLAATEADRVRAAKLQHYFEDARYADPQPMPMRTLHRVIDATAPTCRTRLITNLVLWTREGVPRRIAAQAKIGTSPMVLLLSPSMRCNLRCSGCYAAEYDREDDLPMEVIERVVNEARALGTYAITILGGEPFIRPDILDLFDHFPDMTFQVFTNGGLITNRVATRLENAGNVVVCFSVDGFEADHDARRGTGSLRSAERGMEALRTAGVPFGFSTMVTRNNYLDVTSDEFTDYLIEQGCLWGWHFLYMPVGENPDLSLMPTPEQREYLRTNGAASIRMKKPLFVMDFWNDAPYVGGCIAAGREYLHVNSNGDVEPCIFTHFAVDNVKDKSLSDALGSTFFTAIRDRQPYSENLLRPCMLIDNTSVVREVVTKTGAHATHPGADQLLSTLAEGLDAYAAEYKCIADRVWTAIDGSIPEAKMSSQTPPAPAGIISLLFESRDTLSRDELLEALRNAGMAAEDVKVFETLAPGEHTRETIAPAVDLLACTLGRRMDYIMSEHVDTAWGAKRL